MTDGAYRCVTSIGVGLNIRGTSVGPVDSVTGFDSLVSVEGYVHISYNSQGLDNLTWGLGSLVYGNFENYFRLFPIISHAVLSSVLYHPTPVCCTSLGSPLVAAMLIGC